MLSTIARTVRRRPILPYLHEADPEMQGDQGADERASRVRAEHYGRGGFWEQLGQCRSESAQKPGVTPPAGEIGVLIALVSPPGKSAAKPGPKIALAHHVHDQRVGDQVRLFAGAVAALSAGTARPGVARDDQGQDDAAARYGVAVVGSELRASRRTALT
ncbi:hypothetical protein Ato02nite_065660 [Paractinoplanes toevensis]|uniref:Uncharacterized protein n=1 Tax=Paractinoplanes toevensis TaxID=571911 RepID=A0A919W7C2_9ACTN|nr:hypothetical protein Ato02nite_065660 [Actinoplanes toevensis]